jgi:hypothetical protein
MKNTFPVCVFTLLLLALPTLAQDISSSQVQSQVASVSKPPSAIDAYNRVVAAKRNPCNPLITQELATKRANC